MNDEQVDKIVEAINAFTEATEMSINSLEATLSSVLERLVEASNPH